LGSLACHARFKRIGDLSTGTASHQRLKDSSALVEQAYRIVQLNPQSAYAKATAGSTLFERLIFALH
jgi:hypothetical protein